MPKCEHATSYLAKAFLLNVEARHWSRAAGQIAVVPGVAQACGEDRRRISLGVGLHSDRLGGGCTRHVTDRSTGAPPSGVRCSPVGRKRLILHHQHHFCEQMSRALPLVINWHRRSRLRLRSSQGWIAVLNAWKVQGMGLAPTPSRVVGRRWSDIAWGTTGWSGRGTSPAASPPRAAMPRRWDQEAGINGSQARQAGGQGADSLLLRGSETRGIRRARLKFSAISCPQSVSQTPKSVSETAPQKFLGAGCRC